MNWIDYFSLSRNWSFYEAVILFLIFGSYILWFKPSMRKSLALITAGVLYYIVTASPVAALSDFGLHSISMLQHVVILMLIPLLIWPSLPPRYSGEKEFYSPIKKRIMLLLAWFSGTVTMWIAHFLSAAKIASRTGLSICGVQASADSWVLQIPDQVIWISLLTAGMFFLTPVFSRQKAWRISAPAAVIYLFAACVSCSILGLWVAFSASSATTAHLAPLLTTLRNPLPLSARADQELAGMIMWVPGCVLYVATSVHIALNWLEEGKKENLATVGNKLSHKN